MIERKGGFYRTMSGVQVKLQCTAVTGYLVPRWYVRGQWADERETFVIFRDDKLEEGIYRVYRETGYDTKEFIGFSPTLPFAMRLCATELQRLHSVSRTLELASRQNNMEEV